MVHASEAGPAVPNLCPARSFCAAVRVMSLQIYSMWPGLVFKNFVIGVCYSWMVKQNIRTYVNKTKSCNKSLNLINIVYLCGPGSSVGIATDYGLDGPGSNPGGDEIFRHPDRLWDPPSLLYNGYGVFPGGTGGRSVGLTPTPSSAEVLQRVELYLYSSKGPSWPIKRAKTYLPNIFMCRLG